MTTAVAHNKTSQKTLFKEKHVLEQGTLLYWLSNVEKKNLYFFPWEPQTPFSSLGTLDFLTTYLGIDSLNIRLGGHPLQHNLLVESAMMPLPNIVRIWGTGA